MCGLVGIAGNLNLEDEATMKRLLIFDYFRGPDSTGFAAIRKDNSVKMAKLASHPIDLFDMKAFCVALTGYTSKAFIGHNRYATIGKVNALNAHPFEYGHIVGAHNGTLDMASWKRLNDSNGEETTVDSAAIFLSISKIGVEETVKLLTKGKTSKEGAWALVWFDSSDNTINFLRNAHRPLWVSLSKDKKKIFWASESDMIAAAVGMGPKDYELWSDKKGYQHFGLLEDWWYRVPVDELITGEKFIKDFRHKKVAGREPIVQEASKYAPPFQPGSNIHTIGHPSAYSPTTTPGSTTGAMVELLGNTDHPFGGVISAREFWDYTIQGCAWCCEEVSFGDVGLTVFVDDTLCLCPKCSVRSDSNRVVVNSAEFKTWANVAKAL